MSAHVSELSALHDKDKNDKIDTKILNEVFSGRIDLLITEDKKIHKKAGLLDIAERVYTIESFIEKISAENPDLVEYRVLAVRKEYFGGVDINDPFFDSFKEDYDGFEQWFNRKSEEIAYVCRDEKNDVIAFLYLKVEGIDENYGDIRPTFKRKKRLKVGTFKVVLNGFKLGERFVKIIIDNALLYDVEEIYVTIFDRSDEQGRLIALLEEWGFVYYGVKDSLSGEEKVYVRDFCGRFNPSDPKATYPYISAKRKIFLIPIYPEYHTDLLPDSFLRTESPNDFVENEPHRNAIRKVYISRSIRKDIEKGDLMIFYRTKSGTSSAYYTAVITTVGICDGVYHGIRDENEFVFKCRKRSVFTDEELKKQWNFNVRYRPFIISFLYVYSFFEGNRMNRARLLELGILDGSDNEIRGLKLISESDLRVIIKESGINESLVVD
jgi:hypothetical protein